MSRLISAVRQSLRVDVALFSPVVGLVTAAPVVVLFILGEALSSTTSAIAMAVGANLVAVVSLIGAPRISLRLAILDALGMGLSTLVGVASASSPTWHLLLLIPWCFGAGLLVALGQTQAAIGSQAIIAFTVLGRFAGSWSAAAHSAGLVTLGALGEVLALVLLRLPPSLRHQRLQLARACDAVALLARSAPQTPAIATLAVLDQVVLDLERPALFARADALSLQSILNQLRRARLELTTLAGLRQRVTHPEAEALLALAGDVAADALTGVAGRLRRRAVPAPSSPRASLETLADRLEEIEDGEAVVLSECAKHLRALAGQVRAADGLSRGAEIGAARRAWDASDSVAPESPWAGGRDVLRASVTSMSPALRHAIRLSLAVPTAVLLANWWHLPRGYWLAFSVTVILKPDYSTLLRLGVGRLVGTLLGAVIAALLVSTLHPNALGTAVLVGLCAWVAYSSWSASFSISIGFVTALILILLSTSLHEPITTALDRLLEIGLGGLIATLAYLAWPTPPRAGVVAAEGQLFARLGDYWALVAPLVSGGPRTPGPTGEASRAARLAWGRAEAAVGRSLVEPRTSRVDPEHGQAMLAASTRILRALHALRVEAERGATVSEAPELVALQDAIAQSLSHLGDLLAAQVAPADLRTLYRAALSHLIKVDAPASIGVHLDELVNAINTAQHARDELTRRLARADS